MMHQGGNDLRAHKLEIAELEEIDPHAGYVYGISQQT